MSETSIAKPLDLETWDVWICSIDLNITRIVMGVIAILRGNVDHQTVLEVTLLWAEYMLNVNKEYKEHDWTVDVISVKL